MAQLALEEKLAGEAQAVLEQGFAKKVFVDKREIDVNTRLLAAAKKRGRRRKGRRCLSRTQRHAQAAATGDADVKVGAQYLELRRCREGRRSAPAWHRQGQHRQGRPEGKERVDEAGILLGIAHLRNNNKAEAAKAFRTVKQDPTMVRIAKLWLLNT